jgi:hypothetical protein
VINGNREIVFASRGFRDLKGQGGRTAFGVATGGGAELHSRVGGRVFCPACAGDYRGAEGVSEREGMPAHADCDERTECLDLLVTAAPVHVGGEPFTGFHCVNFGDEKRRQALERVFFHNILNPAGSTHGIAQLLEGVVTPEGKRVGGTTVVGGGAGGLRDSRA